MLVIYSHILVIAYQIISSTLYSNNATRLANDTVHLHTLNITQNCKHHKHVVIKHLLQNCS